MLNRQKHQVIMGRILEDIYSDVSISSLLGFKGGTCAYFFYNLSRFSVDLDFDLLETDTKTQQLVFEKIINIVKKYGEVKDKYIKRFTIFALLSYGNDDRNIKVEINTRPMVKNIREYYEFKKNRGIPMLIAKKDFMFSAKLSALTGRKRAAMRDVYDVHFFAKNNWDFDEEVIKERTGANAHQYLKKCAAFVEKIENNEILQGLGELVQEKEKPWISAKLKSETVFLLKNYAEAMQKSA